uniref:Gelsolin-like domain-containing protein n=1 Tax=Macrostomum lignano TaxID=282301 RepID=A0A1I8FPB1_9PLAT
MTEPSPAQTGGESSTPAACTFRLTFLGKQALNRPTNNTGFGSVQKPLRDIYLAAGLQTGKEPKTDRAAERTFVFDGNAMQIRFWDATARRFQQESWPLDCVTYLDLVLNRPILCFLVRRPYGIQFLECHAYQVEDEATGRQFIDQFDRCSADKARTEHARPSGGRCSTTLRGSRPRTGRVGAPTQRMETLPASASGHLSRLWHPHRLLLLLLLEETCLLKKQQQQEQQPEDRRYKSSGNLGISLMPATDGSFRHHQQQQASLSSGAIQRSASGTIFEKYKELQAFNIPECEYMGFQEMPAAGEQTAG